jgi:HEAT repeat protein
LGRCGDGKFASEVVKLADTENTAIRLATLEALGNLGGMAGLPVLARAAASDASDREQKIARASLRILQPFDPDQALVSVAKEPPAVQIELLQALADRGDSNAQPSLLKLTQHRDEEIRQESLEALGELATLPTIDPLLDLLRDPGSAERADVERALAHVITRAGDAHAASAKLLSLEGGLPDKAQPHWVRLLGRCPTPKGREAVHKASQSPDEEVADAATRVLSNWPDETTP